MNAKMKDSDSLDHVDINNLLETKRSIADAEIKSLFEHWIQARRNVWDAFFGLANANTPEPWKQIVERSTGFYEQILNSVLEAQASALAASLKAFGSTNDLKQLVGAWADGMRRSAETAVQTARKSAEVAAKATVEQSSTFADKVAEKVPEKEPRSPSKAA
jgi:broad specificity phosphatase PhoE